MLLQNFTLLRDKNFSLNSNQTFSCCLCPSFFILPAMDTENRLCSFSAGTMYLGETQQLMKEALLLAKLHIAHELHFLEEKGSSYYHYTSTTTILLLYYGNF